MVSLVFHSLLTACSTRPTDRQAKADLQQWFERQWPGTVSVVEYRNTRGEGDDKTYTTYSQAKARFIKDTEGCVPTCCGDVCFDKLINGFRWTSKASDTLMLLKKEICLKCRGNRHTKKIIKGGHLKTHKGAGRGPAENRRASRVREGESLFPYLGAGKWMIRIHANAIIA